MPLSSKGTQLLADPLVDEDASINRLRRILSSSEGHRYEELLYKQLASIEADLNSEKAASEESQEPTGREYIILQIITKIRKMGVPMERLGSLDAWLQKNVGFAFTLVALGLQAFLKTDLDGHYAIWAAGDFADSLIIGGEDDDQVYLVICLNSTINDLLEDMGMERRVLQKHFFHTYEEDETDAELESDTS